MRLTSAFVTILLCAAGIILVTSKLVTSADLQAVETALEIEGLSNLQEKAKYRKPDRMQLPSKELKKLTKNRYQKVGGSRLIGEHLRLDNSRSTSFHHFISAVHMVMKLNVM